MRHPTLDDRYGPPNPITHPLDQLPRTPIRWLWPGRIPLGALTLLIGDPAAGKSLLTADLAARLTVPHPWPDDPPSERPDPATLPPLPAAPTDDDIERCFPPIRGFPTREIPPTAAVFAAPEDRAVLPDRLHAAGVTPFRVTVLDGVRPPWTEDHHPFRLPTHLGQLEQAIREHDCPGLVVLDPIHLLLDPGVYATPALQTDLLAGLADLAHRKGVAILAVGHFAKLAARRALYRIRGPLTFVAAARSILLLTTDPNDRDRRILTQLKNAYGPPAPPLAFRIMNETRPREGEAPAEPITPLPCREGPGEGRDSSNQPPPALANQSPPCATALEQCSPTANQSPHLEWDDPTNPDWRLSTGDLDLTLESLSALSEACDWLTDFLATGPRPAREVVASAREAGLSLRTLHRAKRLLAIRSSKPANDLPWSWGPPQCPDNQGCQTEHAEK